MPEDAWQPNSAWLIGSVQSDRIEQLQENLSPSPIFPVEALQPWNGYGAADPFAIYWRGSWYVFFEMLVRSQRRAVIAVAQSTNLIDWKVLGIALEQPHHLSYPFVFEHEHQIYMMPESKSQRRVDLFRAAEFPLRWEYCSTLVRGRLMDASIAYYNNRYWMFAGWHSYWLKIFHADSPLGPWHPHWLPVARTYNKRNVRPGGRPLLAQGRLIRWTQDNRQGYGRQLQGMQVKTLNRLWFRETPLAASPTLKPSPDRWYGNFLHHLDLHAVPQSDQRDQGTTKVNLPTDRYVGFFDGY